MSAQLHRRRVVSKACRTLRAGGETPDLVDPPMCLKGMDRPCSIIRKVQPANRTDLTVSLINQNVLWYVRACASQLTKHEASMLLGRSLPSIAAKGACLGLSDPALPAARMALGFSNPSLPGDQVTRVGFACVRQFP